MQILLALATNAASLAIRIPIATIVPVIYYLYNAPPVHKSMMDVAVAAVPLLINCL